MNYACDAHRKLSPNKIACAIRWQCCNFAFLRWSCNPPQQLPYNPPCQRLLRNPPTDSDPPTHQCHRSYSCQCPDFLTSPPISPTMPPFLPPPSPNLSYVLFIILFCFSTSTSRSPSWAFALSSDPLRSSYNIYLQSADSITTS